MMYANKMAVAIKTNGRVLRELKDTVYVKFGSEYSIYMKNLNTTRALVNVFIDGTDITPGGLVIAAGQEVDLQRSIANGNLMEGNALKFIERTAAVENGPRGVKLEDGILRVEFQFEKPYIPPVYQPNPWGTRYGNDRGITGSSGDWASPAGMTFGSISTSNMNVGGTMRSVDRSNGEFVKAAAASAINNYCATNNIQSSVGEVHDGMATMDSMPANDVGVTVPGSKSEQKFQTAYMGAMEPEKHTIVLKLLGETPDNRPVERPVTVKAKPKCVTCGKQNRAHAKFCAECGTALEIFA